MDNSEFGILLSQQEADDILHGLAFLMTIYGHLDKHPEDAPSYARYLDLESKMILLMSGEKI